MISEHAGLDCPRGYEDCQKVDPRQEYGVEKWQRSVGGEHSSHSSQELGRKCRLCQLQQDMLTMHQCVHQCVN